MPLTFLSVASAGPSDILNSSLFTIPKPVGAQQDDFLVAVLACADGTGVFGGFVNPGGWTNMGAGAQTGIGEQIWEKRLGASEPASYDFQNISGSTYHDVSGVILAYVGGQTNVGPDTQSSVNIVSPVTMPIMANTGSVPNRVAYSYWWAKGVGTSPAWTIDAGVTVRATVSGVNTSLKVGDQVNSGNFPAVSSPIANATNFQAQRWDHGDGINPPPHPVESRAVPEFQRRLLKATVQELPYMVTWDMVDEMLRRR